MAGHINNDYGLGELIPKLTGDFQLWYDKN